VTLAAMILVCSVSLSDCTTTNADMVIDTPIRSASPVTCLMHAQAYLAGTSIGRNMLPGERIKVVCVRHRN